MEVITKTLESRLQAEESARLEKEPLEQTIKGINSKMQGLLKFRNDFDEIIRKQRHEIETNAENLASTSRYGFRPLAQRLESFARQVDVFTEQYQPMDQKELSVKAHYIRGVAAHYANDPENVKSHLQKVVQALPDETDKYYSRRRGNSYYYLGVTESNFMEDPADSFHEALTSDPTGDFLTRVAAAEALAMRGDTDAARTASEEIAAQISEKYPPGKTVPSFHRRLKSRAILVQANVEILESNANYQEKVHDLLEPVLKEDPRYYYAIVTFAQVGTERQPDSAEASFLRAYKSILTSDDLPTVTEVRSAVLLRMTAGLCCRQTEDLPDAEVHLEKADQLLEMLPSMNSVPCTVFSVLSKQNESRDIIKYHLELIRDGQTLLPGRASAHAAASNH
jgi:tetratricopeptide (TPR) repeat protein